MPGLYNIITRAPGTLISALIYNFDHQKHVDGRTATLVQSYSTALSQMNLTEDPFPSGSESLAASLAGELARLRFVIAALKSSLSGGAMVNWYDPMIGPGFATIGARVVRATAISIPNVTQTILNFTGNTADFNSGVWSVVNPTRFTAPVTGKYFAACGVLWNAASGSGRRDIRIGVNGVFSAQTARTDTVAATAHTQHQAMVGILNLVATNYVEFAAFQDSGVTMQLTGESRQSIVGGLVFLGS